MRAVRLPRRQRAACFLEAVRPIGFRLSRAIRGTSSTSYGNTGFYGAAGAAWIRGGPARSGRRAWLAVPRSLALTVATG